jgi:hypothetical protein
LGFVAGTFLPNFPCDTTRVASSLLSHSIPANRSS